MLECDFQPLLTRLNATQQRIETAPGRFQQRIEEVFAYARSEILYDAHTFPYQAPLPFIWSHDQVKQDRARRWWFANYVNNPAEPKGTRNRYMRKALLDHDTRVLGVIGDESGSLTLENKNRGAWYVFGAGQIPSHKASGHPRFSKVADKWRPILAGRTTKAWLEVSAPFVNAISA